MYDASYAEVMEDSPALARERERAMFDRAIDLMKRAENTDTSPELRQELLQEATSFLLRLWQILIDDLANPENALPMQLRADLISIGVWNINRINQIIQGATEGFEALIHVNSLIRDGLR